MSRLSSLSLTIGQFVLRYSLVLFFLLFGLDKFTPTEANTIQPLMAHSPVLFWIYRFGDVRTASMAIGVVEIALALLMAMRPFWPRASAIGSFGTAFTLIITLSFLATTPAIDPGTAEFIIKDVTLFGAALWSAGEALAASGRIRGLAASALA
jgi:reactive chlorine resistance protein C